MGIYRNRTAEDMKNIVYFAVFKGVKAVFSRSKSFEIGLYSTETAFNRCKSFVLGTERLCFVTVLIYKPLQKAANGFATVFKSVTACKPVLCGAFIQSFAVRLGSKWAPSEFKPRFS